VWVLDGYRTLEGYAAIAPARVLDYTSPQALAAADVGFVHLDLLTRANLTGTTPLTDYWHQLDASSSRARLVTSARVTSDARADITSIDVSREALLERPVDLEAGPAGTASLLRDAPGDLVVRTATGGRQLLVVSEGYDDWWRAEIDGAPADVERANGDFLGVVVPGGTHEVTLRFRPAHRPVGMALSLLGAMATLALALAPRARSSR
jgi:hypothetical protein